MNFSLEDTDTIVATAARALAMQGAARELAILAYGEAEFEESGYDNWNGGQTSYVFRVFILSLLYEQIRSSRKALETSILSSLKEIFERFDSDFVNAVQIHQQLSTNKTWKENAQAWCRGENVNNQGRVRSDNIAPLEKDGLLFRSTPEILLYEALKQLNVPIAPLPVFVQGDATYQRIEPDLLVVKHGLMMVVEVDGENYHLESPATASARLEMLTSHGIHIKRVHANECSTPSEASVAAQKILDYMAKLKQSQG